MIRDNQSITHATSETGVRDIMTTQATFETGDKDRTTTHTLGEEGEPIDVSTHAVGEEGEPIDVSTLRVGEEGDVSTFAVGEEGEPIRDIPPINNDYNLLLLLIKQLIDKIRRNIGIGIGINPPPIAQDPIISDPPPVIGRPVPRGDYTNSMPTFISANSVRVEHAYLPEAE